MIQRILIILIMFLSLAACNMPVPAGQPHAPAGQPPSPQAATLAGIPPPTVMEPPATLQPQNLAPVPTRAAQAETASTPVPQPTLLVDLPSTPALINLEGVRFIVQSGTPVRMANFVRPQEGCKWMGIGGQVFNQDGIPITGLIMEVMGTLEGKDRFELALTGSTTSFGPGSFEIMLAEQPVASLGTLALQVYDLYGNALSDLIPFNTSALCEENLVLINLIEFTGEKKVFLPMVNKNYRMENYLPNVQGRFE